MQVSFASPEGDYPALPEPFDVKYGEAPNLPTPTGNDKWTFGGWFTDAALTQAYDGSALTKDTVFYAKWNPVEDEVEYAQISFVYPEGMEGAPDPMRVVVGSTPGIPEPAAIEGYKFAGWFVDAELTVPYNEDAVASDLILYAKWEPLVDTAGDPQDDGVQDDLMAAHAAPAPQPNIVSTGDIVLYVIIGVLAVAVIAVLIVLGIRRSRK